MTMRHLRFALLFPTVVLGAQVALAQTSPQQGTDGGVNAAKADNLMATLKALSDKQIDSKSILNNWNNNPMIGPNGLEIKAVAPVSLRVSPIKWGLFLGDVKGNAQPGETYKVLDVKKFDYLDGAAIWVKVQPTDSTDPNKGGWAYVGKDKVQNFMPN